MKRITVLTIALLASAAVFAQEEKKAEQATGTVCEVVLAQPQGSYTPSFKVDGKEIKVKNVILMIGDGMGLGAVTSAFYANGGELTMMNLKTMGHVRTQSASDFTTDSAASGTAYACGQKTTNGFVGMNPDKMPIANIPEKIASLGYACGVVSSDDVHGATPAAFFAHQAERGASDDIWADLPASKLDFISAGTQKKFESLPLKTQDAIKGKFSVVYSPEEANAFTGSKSLMYLPETVETGKRGEYLPETTEMAINYLSKKSKKGFFLMVEGARIDKNSHSNNFEGCVKETLDFDKAIEAAIRFAEKDGHTLVIISADHETGALSLRSGNIEENTIKGVYVSKGHSPITVPLFAYGPKSRHFAGTQHNSDVSNKIVEILSK